jgi:hypothetical protein
VLTSTPPASARIRIAAGVIRAGVRIAGTPDNAHQPTKGELTVADLEGASRDFTDGLRTLADRVDDRVAHDLYAAPAEAADTTGPSILADATLTFSDLIQQLAKVAANDPMRHAA